MNVNFIKDFTRTCPDCHGHKFYKTSGKCVTCMSREAQKSRIQTSCVSIATKPTPGTFDLKDLRNSEYKNAERKMFAGVQYQNEPRIYE